MALFKLFVLIFFLLSRISSYFNVDIFFWYKMNITVHRLHDMRLGNEPHTLLDIRETHELEVCSIDGSIDIPMNTLPENMDKLPKEKPLVVMCHIGGRSAQVTNWLIQNGYNNALNLEGGISAWAQVIDTEMAQY
jgi:rhodanese-related sulfurtransferase